LKKLIWTVILLTTIFFTKNIAKGQTNSCDKVEVELVKLYKKIFPFYYGDQDTLFYYSELFSSKLKTYIVNNPSTLDCKFKLFQDSIGSIATSPDGEFRIYSWDTWTGGTMHHYQNLFQFKSGSKVYTPTFDFGEGDMGTYFTNAYLLKAGGKNYFLSTSTGSESSKYWYESIHIYSITDSTINENVAIIKTPDGLKNYILIEFDASSVLDRPERPLQLIKYDSDKKIIYVPIIIDEKVTDRYTLYQFTGQYFEKIK